MIERTPLSHYGRIELGTIKMSSIDMSDHYDRNQRGILDELAREHSPYIIPVTDPDRTKEDIYIIGILEEDAQIRWICCQWVGSPYIAATYEFIDSMIIPHPVPAHKIKTGEYIQIAAYLPRLVHQNPHGEQVLLIDGGVSWFWLRTLYHRLAYLTETALAFWGFIKYD